MGCQTQKIDMLANVTDDVQRRPRLTPKGERTRARIVDAAARLIYERGVAGTTLEDIRAAAEVSGSQLSHYFVGKDELVQAVIDHQAGAIIGSTEQAGLATIEGLRAWRDMVVAAARSTDGRGGCPLGSLGSQLAETDPQARDLIAGGFERWSAVIADGLRALPAAGHLPAGISSDDLSVTLLAALQGGLLLAQVQRDTRPLETAVDTILALAGITGAVRSTDGLRSFRVGTRQPAPPLRRAERTTQSGQMKAGRARYPLPGPPWDLRQSPRSVRNRLVYSSGVVLETELQVGDAKSSEQGVSRSKDQKCTPARPLLFT
jgi:AcrR family transcriptional regulator